MNWETLVVDLVTETVTDDAGLEVVFTRGAYDAFTEWLAARQRAAKHDEPAG